MTEITVKLVHNDSERTVKTRVLTYYGDGILVTPITCDDQIVNYCPKATIEYTEPATGLKHVFESDYFARANFNGTDFHIIKGKELVISDRHRKAERYMVQIMGVGSILGQKPATMVINDVSMRGISLLIGQGQNVKLGDEIRLSFFKDKNTMKRITAKCEVVRLFKIGNYNAAGCVLKGLDRDMLNFINEKKQAYNEKMNVKVAG